MAFIDEGMKRWNKRVALVTGSSGGIGLDICKKLASYGLICIGTGRKTEKIEELATECEKMAYEGKVISYACDLSKEDEILNMFAWIKNNHGGIDVCINSAGFSNNTTLLNATAQDLREMLDINVVALVLCTNLTVKSMIERNVNDGHIFNINSMSGHRLVNILNFYAATKFAVTAITEGFRKELVENSRIKITQISPGLVETGFLGKTFGEKTASDIFKRVQGGGGCIQSENIGQAVIYALSAPEFVQVHDILMRPTGDKY